MRRRDFVILLAGAMAGRPCAARAQQKAMPVIGFLDIGGPRGPTQGTIFQAAFRKGLSETGYADGQNVRIEYRWAEGKPERFPALAAELVTLNVDVIASLEAHSRRWLPSGRRLLSPLSYLVSAIRLLRVSSRASRIRAAISRGCPLSLRNSSASAWNCSSRLCRGSV